MAKGKVNEAEEMKKLLSDIYKIVLTTNSASKEQIKVNRELLKVMTVLNSGFAKNQEDARMLIDEMNDELGKGLELSDEFLKSWAKARGAQKQDLDDLIKKFKELDDVDEDIIDNSKDYIDLLKSRYELIDDEVDLTKKLLSSHEAMTRVIRESKRTTDKLGGSLAGVEQELKKMVANKTNLTTMFGGMSKGLEDAMELVDRVQADIGSMVENVSGSIIDFKLKFNPLTNELDEESAKILKNVQIEKDARLDGLKEYFTQNEKLQKNLARQIALQGTVSFKIDDITEQVRKLNPTVSVDPIVNFKDLDEIVQNVSVNVDNLAEVRQLLSTIKMVPEIDPRPIDEYLMRLEDQKIEFDQLKIDAIVRPKLQKIPDVGVNVLPKMGELTIPDVSVKVPPKVDEAVVPLHFTNFEEIQKKLQKVDPKLKLNPIVNYDELDDIVQNVDINVNNIGDVQDLLRSIKMTPQLDTAPIDEYLMRLEGSSIVLENVSLNGIIHPKMDELPKLSELVQMVELKIDNFADVKKQLEKIKKLNPEIDPAPIDAFIRDFESKKIELKDVKFDQIITPKIKMPKVDDILIGATIDVDTGQIRTANGILQEGTKEYEQLVSRLDALANSNSVTEQMKVGFEEIVGLMKVGASRTDVQDAKLNQLLKPLGIANEMLVEQIKLQYDDLDAVEAQVNEQKRLHKMMNLYLGQLQTAEQLVLKVGQGFDYINAILPSGISEFLGISKVSQVLMDSHQRGAKSFAEEITKSGDKTKALNSYLKQMEPAISLALNPMTILIASAALLGTFLASVVERYKNMASEMKISLMQAKQLNEVQLDTLTSQKNQFASLQDIQDIQTEMIGSSGVMGNLLDKSTQQLTINLSEMGKVFGYGNAEAVKLHKTFSRLGADEKLAQNLQLNLGYMAEMAGISPQIVSQDLIDSAETVSTYFAGMPDKAAKAVLQVRRMGMSLQQAGAIAQKMLDLEGFMTDMYELQAMTGGGIDFSSAFDKGLMGDIEGMTKDIMNTIGTTAEYNKMDYLTRMKISKTLGMSVDELGKSVNLHEKMNGMLPEQQKYLEANLDKMGDISQMSQEDIRNRMEQLQSTDRLGVAWDKIKGVLVKALIPLAETFADAIDAISPLIDGIIGGLKLVGLVIKPFVPLIKGLLAPFKLIGDTITWLTTNITEFLEKNKAIGSVVSGLTNFFSGLSDVVYGIGAAIGTWFIITKFTSVIGGIISMFGGLFKTLPLIGSLFGGIGKKSVDVVSESKSSVDALNAGVKTSIGDMVSSIKIAMSDMVKTVQESFKTISSTPIRPPVIEPSLVGVDKVKKGTKSLVSDVAADVAQSTAEVGKVATSAKESIVEVQKTGKKGFFKSDAGKQTFKVIGALGASTFASLATKAALSFIPMEEGASGTLTAIAGMAGPLLGTAFSSVGTLLSDSLSEAFDRVTRKTIEKKLEGKFEEPLKNIRNKMGSLGDPAAQSLETVGKTGTSVFERLKNAGKNLLPTSLFKKTTIVEDLSNVDVKPMETLGDTLQTVTDKVEQTQTVEEKVKSKKVKQIPTSPLETIDQTVTRKTTVEDEPIAKKIVRKTSKVQPAEIIETKPTKSKLSSLSDVFSKGFDGIVDIVKKSWSTLKSVLLDIVDFAGDVLKSISGAVGESIKKLLTGIGDGLSSFKTSALKGAASLLVVSGALWVTSKALQNFAKVSWEDVGKGIVTLGGLTAAALALGKVAGQVLIGAAAIALLGASLIPAAYALNEFNKVNWSSLAKAGVALVGLGVIGVVMSAISAPVIIGSLAIAALGASLIPLAFALGKFNEIGWDSLAKAGVALVGFGAAMAIFGTISPVILAGSVALGAASLSLFAFAGSMTLLNSSIQTLNPKPLAEFGKTLLDVTTISVSSLFGISAGLISIGAAMLTFQTMSSLGNGLSAIFGKGVVNDLEKLGNLADPLYIVANSIGSLVNNLGDLSQVLGNVDLTNVEKLKNFDEIGVDTKISRQIEPLAEMQDRTKVQRDNTDVRISPIQQPLVRPFTPNKESVAQNVEVQTPKKEAVGQNIKIDPIKSFTPLAQAKQFDKQDESDIYGGDEITDFSKMEMLLMRIAQMMEIQAKQTPFVLLDGQKVGTIQKKYNNS